MSAEKEVLGIISPYLTRIKTGKGGTELTASCPFHVSQGGPSSTLSFCLTRGIFHCWSCGASGTLRTFLELVSKGKLRVPKHVQESLDIQRKKDPKQQSTKSFLKKGVDTELPEGILGLFDYCPIKLLEAGFDKQVLRYFEIGYDQWHDTITFPIRDLHGQLIGIVGRYLQEDVGTRYKLYTYEYQTWDLPTQAPLIRSHTIWHAHKFHDECAKAPNDEPGAIVEGYKACMWVYQAGFKKVFPLSGNNLTDSQVAILGRMSNRYILMLDGDEAGQKKMGVTQAKLRKHGMGVRAVHLPDQKQPDGMPIDWIQENVRWR